MSEDLAGPDSPSTSFSAWLGKFVIARDVIAPNPVRALSATLDRDDPEPQPGDEVPALWHWLYFLTVARASEIGSDGHPRRGDFLPPVALPRRMRAGGQVLIEAPLRIGDRATRRSTVKDIVEKQGRDGPLVFVTVLHEVHVGAVRAIVEEEDIVYRNPASPGSRPPPPLAPPAEPEWSRRIDPDPVLLFRLSALTFNAHRIHYDRDYATREEGYPGLVVQAPLTVLLLLDLLRRNLPQARVQRIRFRAIRPLFDTAAFEIQGRHDGGQALLWALDSQGALAMKAEVDLAGQP